MSVHFRPLQNLHQKLKNRSAWISVAEFLAIDPLVKLGIPSGFTTNHVPLCLSGEAAAAGKRSAAAAGLTSGPDGNHGDNLSITQGPAQ